MAPWMQATSPTAEMSRSLVRQVSSTTIAAARADLEARRAAQLVARPHARGDHDDVRVDPAAVGQVQPAHAAAPVRADLRGHRVEADPDTEVVDEPPQRLAAAEVDLRRHEVRAHLQDGRAGTERLERTGRLEPEQTATEDGALDHPVLGELLDVAAQLRDVVDRAVDEHARQVRALDRRDPGRRARRQDEVVVVLRAAVRRGHRLRVTVDVRHRVVADQGHQRVGPQRPGRRGPGRRRRDPRSSW